MVSCRRRTCSFVTIQSPRSLTVETCGIQKSGFRMKLEFGSEIDAQKHSQPPNSISRTSADVRVAWSVLSCFLLPIPFLRLCRLARPCTTCVPYHCLASLITGIHCTCAAVTAGICFFPSGEGGKSKRCPWKDFLSWLPPDPPLFDHRFSFCRELRIGVLYGSFRRKDELLFSGGLPRWTLTELLLFEEDVPKLA